MKTEPSGSRRQSPGGFTLTESTLSRQFLSTLGNTLPRGELAETQFDSLASLLGGKNGVSQKKRIVKGKVIQGKTIWKAVPRALPSV